MQPSTRRSCTFVIKRFRGPGVEDHCIPGFSTTVAEVFIAEAGADMTVFPSAAHLASLAGTSLETNESAGRVKSTKTRPGNRYLKGVLGIAALSATRIQTTWSTVLTSPDPRYLHSSLDELLLA
jgi:transposase